MKNKVNEAYELQYRNSKESVLKILDSFSRDNIDARQINEITVMLFIRVITASMLTFHQVDSSSVVEKFLNDTLDFIRKSIEEQYNKYKASSK